MCVTTKSKHALKNLRIRRIWSSKKRILLLSSFKLRIMDLKKPHAFVIGKLVFKFTKHFSIHKIGFQACQLIAFK